jgi:hypothetical protein
MVQHHRLGLGCNIWRMPFVNDFNFPFKIVIFTPTTAEDFKVLMDYQTDHPSMQVSSTFAGLIDDYNANRLGVFLTQKGKRLEFWFDTDSEAQSFASWYNQLPLIAKHPIYTCLVQDVVPEYRATIPRPTTIPQFHKLMFLLDYYPGRKITASSGVKATREKYVKQKTDGTAIDLEDYDREYHYYSHNRTLIREFSNLFGGTIVRL